jgi:maltooligosyltrehalose trehalohydrolase
MSRLLGYSQTHDQVGNRAGGERLCHLVSPAQAKVAAALVLTAPFVPQLFMGEEWAASTPFLYFTDHDDPELGQAISEGRRREFAVFGWDPDDVADPQDPATFARSVLQWPEVDRAEHAEMLAWYRSLIRLRQSQPDLGDGRHPAVDLTESVLTMRRGAITVVANLGDEPAESEVTGHLLLASDPEVRVSDGTRLPPWSAAILAREVVASDGDVAVEGPGAR